MRSPALLRLIRAVCSVLFFLPSSHSLTGQTPPNSPTGPSEGIPSPSGITLHVNSNIVLLDIVVTDRKHQAIHGLTVDDFTLVEGGKPQKLDRVEEHVSPAAPLQPKPAPHSRPRNVFSNTFRPASTGTPTVILMDMLNTSLVDQPFVKEEIYRFIKQASPTVPVAIFGLTSRLLLLQSFTSDPELLRAAISDKKKDVKHWSHTPNDSDALLQHNRTADVYEDAIAEGISNPAGMTTRDYAELQKFEEGVTRIQQEHSNVRTLDALNSLARYLRNIPGRKNLIWISTAFPLTVTPDLISNNSFDLTMMGRVHDTSMLMAQARIAVYPIDPRGASTLPVYTAANGDRSELRRSHDLITNNVLAENQHMTMQSIAEETGGEATFNTNDLSRAIERAAESGASYYALSYIPGNLDRNNKPRKVKIELRDKSYHLNYRRSYIADNNRTPGRTTPAENIAAALSGAMLLGSPVSTRLSLEAAIDYDPDLEDRPAPGNEVASPALGPFRHYRVDYHVNIRNFGAPETPDGLHHLAAKFLLLVYSSDGRAINSVTNVMEGKLSASSYKELLQDGIRVHQDVSVPSKGDYVLRMAVQDVATEQTGAIEVPVSSILPPQSETPTAAKQPAHD